MKLLQTSQALFLATRGASKISVALNLRRMFNVKIWANRLCDGLIVSHLMWVVAATLAILIECSSEHFLVDQDQHLCSDDVSSEKLCGHTALTIS